MCRCKMALVPFERGESFGHVARKPHAGRPIRLGTPAERLGVGLSNTLKGAIDAAMSNTHRGNIGGIDRQTHERMGA